MSLITEALQLRKNQPRSRVRSGESFPPLRQTSPVGKLFAVLVVLAGLVVLGFWKGTWLLEQLESIAGIRTNPPVLAPVAAEAKKSAEPIAPTPIVPAPMPKTLPDARAGQGPSPAPTSAPSEKRQSVSAEINGVKSESATPAVDREAKGLVQNQAMAEKAGAEKVLKAAALPEPMDVNLTLSMIEDEKARQQLDEENQRKIESFLRRMDVQGVCHQGQNSTALLDTVLVRPGDPVGNLGLTLRRIETRRLVFSDRNGREYTKSY